MTEVEDLISEIVTDNESLQVLISDMPDTLPIEDQLRLHAIRIVLNSQRDKLSSLNNVLHIK